MEEEYNNYDDEQLDLQYRNSLSEIRSFIPNVNKNYYLKQYSVWLDKISNAKNSEKILRNFYLKELTTQIKNQNLKFPFTQIPPEGPLLPYNKEMDDFCSNGQKKAQNVNKGLKILPQICHKVEAKTEEEETEAKEQKHKYESSSWYDITTDDSLSSLQPSFSKNNFEKYTNFELNGKILKKSHEVVVDEPMQEKTENDNYDPMNQLARNESKNFVPNGFKNTLKDTNFIRDDWKRTIEALQLRLTETSNQNNELKLIINGLRNQRQEDEVAVNNLKIKLNEIHEIAIKELELKQIEKGKNLEKSYQTKLHEMENVYQQKIDKIKSNYETKMKNIDSDYEHFLKEKEFEINKLNNVIQQQCTRMTNEITSLRSQIKEVLSSNDSEEKILFLQKCVSKMGKLFQKSEKKYITQIENLKKELNYLRKVNQIQMKAQRADLISKNCSEKQSHFDLLVSNLDIRYKNILELQEIQTHELKKQSEEKFTKLKSILTKHKIPFEID